MIRDWLHGKGGKAGPAGFRVRLLVQRDRDYCQSMLEPPVGESVMDLWYAGKITEFAAVYLFEPETGDAEFFCARQKRLAASRVQAVREHIARRLDEPFDLKKMARDIGCSPFYLSRIFSEYTGMPIGKFRQLLRVRKAAELLRSGRFNVSEASLEVGYNSLSHFSKAFAEVMKCRPSDYARGE